MIILSNKCPRQTEAAISSWRIFKMSQILENCSVMSNPAIANKIEQIV